MKIHLGCGNKYLPGYYHIDAQKFNHVDRLADVKNLDFISSCSVDEIYACHVLEHFGRQEIESVLKEWIRVLKPGGVIRLSVPDLDAVFEEYKESKDLNRLIGLIYGGQKNDYDFHKFGFTFKSLTAILEACGISRVEKYAFKEFLPIGFDDFSRAFIPHMDESGRLMSLNVVGIK